MNLETKKIKIKEPLLLIGGGSFKERTLKKSLKFSKFIVAVDGGANHLKNIVPEYIIGDLDSLKNKNFWYQKDAKIIKIKEQNTTDFEKSLYTFDSSLYLCIGFTGGRIDHFFSVCSSLIKNSEKKIILIGKRDLIFHLPKRFKINLPIGSRFSLIPFEKDAKLSSNGLKWRLESLKLNFSQKISISNQTDNDQVIIKNSKKGILGIIEKKFLKNLIESMNINNL